MDRKGFNKHKDDHHYHLFVESHLKYLMKNFNIIKVGYPKFYGRPLWKNIILYSLPFKMGYSEIRILGVKK
jgi:hypothetical protein